MSARPRHERRRDDGFVDVDGAAACLSVSRASIYHLVERDRYRIPGRRLLFGRQGLRAWVERLGGIDDAPQ